MKRVTCSHCGSDNLEALAGYPTQNKDGTPGVVEHFVCLACGKDGSASCVQVGDVFKSTIMHPELLPENAK